jgi:hypothetical protein
LNTKSFVGDKGFLSIRATPPDEKNIAQVLRYFKAGQDILSECQTLPHANGFACGKAAMKIFKKSLAFFVPFNYY